MANSVLDAPHFQTEPAAFAYVEAALWPHGPTCPHCGETKRVGRLNGKATRPGLLKCYACKGQFTVRVGTIFEDSHLPLHLWLQVIHLMCASKKGIATRQIQRMLNCSMKTAWFLGHRIREAMTDKGGNGTLGGNGKVVEVDETYFGQIESPSYVSTRTGKPFKTRRGRGGANKRVVLALVERGGSARTFHVESVNHNTVHNIMRANIARESRVHTDESMLYTLAPWRFASHETVKHSADEYVRGDVTTNTVEGYFSVFKRGMRGTYQQCAEKHLHRYLAEFDFRYNNRIKRGVDDTKRATLALKGVVGKRLTYQTIDRSQA